MNKKHKKLHEGSCYFCGEKDYDLLDCHRIIPGEKDGKYNNHNVIVICCKCHRKTHSGRIKVHGRHYCTNGKWLLHYTEDGKENWK